MNIRSIPTKLLLEESKYRRQRELQFRDQLFDTKDQLSAAFYLFFFNNADLDSQIRKVEELGRLLQEVEKTGEFASIIFDRDALFELHAVVNLYFDDYNKAEVEKGKLEAVRAIRRKLHGRNEEAPEWAIWAVFSMAFDQLVTNLVYNVGREDPTSLKGGLKRFIEKFK